MLDDICVSGSGGRYFACLAGTPTTSYLLTPFLFSRRKVRLVSIRSLGIGFDE